MRPPQPPRPDPSLSDVTEPSVAVVTSTPPEPSFSGPLPAPGRHIPELPSLDLPEGRGVKATALGVPRVAEAPRAGPDLMGRLTPPASSDDATAATLIARPPAPTVPAMSPPLGTLLEAASDLTPTTPVQRVSERPSTPAPRREIPAISWANAGVARKQAPRRWLAVLIGAGAAATGIAGLQLWRHRVASGDEERNALQRRAHLDLPSDYMAQAQGIARELRASRPSPRTLEAWAERVAVGAARTARPELVDQAKVLLKQAIGEGRSAPVAAILVEGLRDPAAGYALATTLVPGEPKRALLSLAAGLVAARAGQSSEALGLLDEAALLEPDLVAVHLQRAGLLRRLGRVDEASQAAERARGLAPQSPLAELEAAIAAMLAAQRDAPAAARLEAAIRLAEPEVRGAPPWEAELSYARGRLALARGDLEGARTELGQALRRWPEPEYEVAFGRAELLPGGDAHKAVERLTERPGHAGSIDARLALAEAALRVGHPDLALRALEKIRDVTLSPSATVALSTLRLQAKADLDDEPFVDAICLTHLKSDRPDDEALLLCAEARPQSGYADKALEAVSRRDLRPVARGMLALRRGETREAVQLLQAAASGPTAPWFTLVALVRANLALGETKAAVVAAERLAHVEGGSARSQLWHALALGKDDRADEARRILSDALTEKWTGVRLRKLHVQIALGLGEIKLARGAVELAATLQEPPSAAVLALGARVSMAEGSLARADREIVAAFKRDDQSPEVAGAMLELELRKKNRDGTRMILERVFEPHRDEALFDLAKRDAYRAAGVRAPGEPAKKKAPKKAKR